MLCVSFNVDANPSGYNTGKWTQLKNTLNRNVMDKVNGKKKSRKYPFPQTKLKADIIMAIYKTTGPNIRETYAIAFFVEGKDGNIGI